MSNPVLSHVENQLISRAKALIIGLSSEETGAKATGLKYSMEYFLRESKNEKRGHFHRTNALVAYLVLSSPDLEAFILENLVPRAVAEVLDKGFAASGLAAEESEQAVNDVTVKNGTKAVKNAAKNGPKTKAKRATAKKVTKASPKKTVARKATVKAAK